MSHYEDVQYIINAAAVDLGLKPVADVLSSTNDAFQQLRYLMDSAGQALVRMKQDGWADLQAEHQITTTSEASYVLPDDFSHMINQAGWDRTNDVPLQGPLSAQDWQYLKGRNLVNQTIYVSFRLKEGKFYIFPDDPVTTGLDINFEYVRNTWLEKVDESTTKYHKIEQNTDIVLFPPILIKEFLKVKFLEAKGFDSSKARDDFAMMMEAAAGQDASAPILNAGNRRGYPYIDIYRNTPDTRYGI